MPPGQPTRYTTRNNFEQGEKDVALSLAPHQTGCSAWTKTWTNCVPKENSSETMPLSCEFMVGVRRFELLTSSVSERLYGVSASCSFMPNRAKRAGRQATRPSTKYHFVSSSGGLRALCVHSSRAPACTRGGGSLLAYTAPPLAGSERQETDGAPATAWHGGRGCTRQKKISGPRGP